MRFTIAPALLKSLFDGKHLKAKTTPTTWQAGHFSVETTGSTSTTMTVFLHSPPNQNQFSPTPSTTEFHVSQAMFDAVESVNNGVFQADWTNLPELPKPVRR
jgi:hypothetical protein